MIDVPERGRSKVRVLVEGRPSPQLAVQAVHHIDFSKIVITREDLRQSVRECLGPLFGYGRDDRHPPARSPLANDPMPQKDEAIIDVGDMGFLHIQRQLQLAFQKGPALLAGGLAWAFVPLTMTTKSSA